ncbi:MAG TPA: hypothetical protein VK553_02715 [Candidatus Nitrosopolaris rasttigaisensis]|nr:hypothetical protein [Candidatus Nitrosopolaris rasttigaisensis]
MLKYSSSTTLKMALLIMVDLAQYASDSISDLKQSLKDFKLVGSTKNNVLAGLPAYKSIYTTQITTLFSKIWILG